MDCTPIACWPPLPAVDQSWSAPEEESAGRPGVDKWMEAEFAFPGGATGRSLSHMADDWCMTLRLIGSTGELTVADYVQPHKDDRVLVTNRAGTRNEELGK